MELRELFMLATALFLGSSSDVTLSASEAVDGDKGSPGPRPSFSFSTRTPSSSDRSMNDVGDPGARPVRDPRELLTLERYDAWSRCAGTVWMTDEPVDVVEW